MAMNKAGHKSLSVVFTSLIILTLVLMGPANAVSILISEPNDANQGGDVEFTVTVDLTTPDMYLPVAYTNLIFTNPDGSQFECKVFNDGSTDCDNINAEVTFDTSYGEGHQFGYGYGYQPDYGYGYEYTYFGYGYGYGYGYWDENGQITYDITLHLEENSQVGEYKVKAETFVASEDSFDDNQGFDYCDTMLGMYRGYYNARNENGSFYDPALDLHPDGVIDLSDISVFGAHHSDDAELFGRFVEFFRFRANQTVNPELDVYPEDEGDGIINLSDVVIFAQHYFSEDADVWCAEQISLIPGVERAYLSEEQSFVVSEETQEQNTPNGGGPSGGSGGCGQGYVRDEITGQCVLDTTQLNIEPTTTEGPTEGEGQEGSGEENGNRQSGEGTDVFNAITGAVVGAGDSIGLGETLSYLLSLLIFALIITGFVRVFRRK